MIPPNKKDFWIKLNWALDKAKTVEKFTETINTILSEFPLTTNYFQFWLKASVISRAFPAMCKIPPKLTNIIRRDTCDIEWMHGDMKNKNYGFNKNSSVDEVITSLFRYCSSLYAAEHKALCGVKTNRKRYRKNETGDTSTKGPEKKSQMTKSVILKKFNFIKTNLKSSSMYLLLFLFFEHF